MIIGEYRPAWALSEILYPQPGGGAPDDHGLLGGWGIAKRERELALEVLVP